jgi:origin recognition complex subunit 5
VLVFDGIDQQREAPPTLLPALARLGEFVRENIVALRTPERS